MDPRIMLDSLDAGVAAIGPDWTIAEWSAPAARITGLAAERVGGRDFWSAFPAAKSQPPAPRADAAGRARRRRAANARDAGARAGARGHGVRDSSDAGAGELPAH